MNRDEVRTLQNRVGDAERAVFSWRARRLEVILTDLQAGLGRPERDPSLPMIEDYVIEVAGYRDLQTVSILSGTMGLSNLIDRAAGAAGAQGIQTWSQSDRDLATFVCRVLGRLELDEAVEPLSRWLEVVRDPELTVEAGIALCNTRRAEADPALFRLQQRVGAGSLTWQRVGRYYNRVPQQDRLPATAGSDRWLQRGLQRLMRRKFDDALSDFDRVLEADPKNPDARYGRGSILLEKGEFSQAVQAPRPTHPGTK